MNHRERYVASLTFGNPDRVVFNPGGPRESTIARWQNEGLPKNVNWMTYLLETIGVTPDPPRKPRINLKVNFRMMPEFEEKVVEHRDGHYVVQDWKGNICEISDKFDITYLRAAKDFVTRRWIKCPVENRADWEKMKERYRLDTPGRLPSDFEDLCRKAKDRDWNMSIQFSGSFWQLREWCGFEGLCMMLIDEPGLVAEMAEFWKEFAASMLDRVFEHVTPDHILFDEDMAYKEKAMISPAMAREFCMPSWKRWAGQAKKAGVPVIDLDSDGYIAELIPLWIESGVNNNCPFEIAAGNDIVKYREMFGHKMAYTGAVDKRNIAKGGKVLRDEMKRLEPIVRDGGFIPSCDHGIPSDVSWPNMVEYSRLLAKLTGWL